MIFRSVEFGAIRTMSSPQGEPMFCAKDVCEMLELRTQKVVQRLGDDVLLKYPIVDNLGRTQQATLNRCDEQIAQLQLSEEHPLADDDAVWDEGTAIGRNRKRVSRKAPSFLVWSNQIILHCNRLPRPSGYCLGCLHPSNGR